MVLKHNSDCEESTNSLSKNMEITRKYLKYILRCNSFKN